MSPGGDWRPASWDHTAFLRALGWTDDHIGQLRPLKLHDAGLSYRSRTTRGRRAMESGTADDLAGAAEAVPVDDLADGASEGGDRP